MNQTSIDKAKKLIEAYYEQSMQIAPDVPKQMIMGDWEQDGWNQWKLIPSVLNSKDIASLEEKLPYKLPEFYKAYLLSYCVLEMDFGKYRLSTIRPDRPLESVKFNLFWETLSEEHLWKQGFAPFASNDHGDPVCFDILSKEHENDYPIYVINHDGSEINSGREVILKESLRVSDSFEAFFAELCENFGSELEYY